MKYLNYESRIHCTENSFKVALTSFFSINNNVAIKYKIDIVKNTVERKFLFCSGGF